MAAPRKIDYGEIEPGWRAGRLTPQQLADAYMVTHPKIKVTREAIIKHFKGAGIPRDLGEKARATARAMVAAAKVTPGKVTPGKVTPGKVTPGKVTPGKVTPRGKVTPAPSDRDIIGVNATELAAIMTRQ